MQYERYEDVTASDDFVEYHFTSVGPNGNINKTVQFAPTEIPDVFNLAFGNKMKDGSLDDLAKNNNNDRNKIIATVVFTIQLFFSEYPDKWIFFMGSTPERTRLYRMAITINLTELLTRFDIFGLLEDNESFVRLPFEKGVDYFGFLIKKKLLVLHMKHEKAIKKAASMGVKLTITNQSAGKVLFPEKLEQANKVLAKLKMPLPA